VGDDQQDRDGDDSAEGRGPGIPTGGTGAPIGGDSRDDPEADANDAGSDVNDASRDVGGAGDPDGGSDTGDAGSDTGDTGDRTPEEGAGHVLPDEVAFPEGARTALPPVVERWRKRSVTGAMMTGFALGLREVLETEQREPAIVLETSGVPPKDLPVEADLENLPPRQSVVKIRRWLLTAPPDEAGIPAAGDGGTDPTDTDEASGDATAGEETVVAPGRTTEIRKRDSNRKRGRRASGRFFRGDRSEGKRS
jgi:hypothetical protein